MKLRTIRRAFIGLFVLGAALGAWATVVEPAMLRERLVVAETTMWPAGRPPLRIGVISDLHAGAPHIGLDKIDEVVARMNALRPDIVLLAGDYVAHVMFGRKIAPEDIGQRLGKLRAPLGLVAVMGNHDWVDDGPRLRRAFQAAGIKILNNEPAAIGTGPARFWIAGVDDTYSGRNDIGRALAGTDESEPLIVLTHDPALFPEVPARAAITIAGHTHGGQVTIPGIGPIVNASRAPLSHSSGLISENGKLLYVSSGIGTSVLPIRFNAPPEIGIVVLKAPGAR